MKTTTPASFLTNDKTRIYYEHTTGPTDTCIVLIHGFSGSSAYFKHNVAALADFSSVVAYDLRGHGQSEHSSHGYHVSRLAADLHDLLEHISQKHAMRKFVGIGCSIGAAILWSYTELYTNATFSHFVFVDQAPLQNYAADGSWGPEMGNYGCHDAASCAWFQANLLSDLPETSRGLVAGCLGYRFKPDVGDESGKDQERLLRDEAFFMNISTQCDPAWIGKLMSDHTQYDHRDTIRHCIDIPTLVIAGKRSGCFPLRGMTETARLINEEHANLAETHEMDSGHWLFYEDPEEFNDCVIRFLKKHAT